MQCFNSKEQNLSREKYQGPTLDLNGMKSFSCKKSINLKDGNSLAKKEKGFCA